MLRAISEMNWTEEKICDTRYNELNCRIRNMNANFILKHQCKSRNIDVTVPMAAFSVQKTKMNVKMNYYRPQLK